MAESAGVFLPAELFSPVSKGRVPPRTNIIPKAAALAPMADSISWLPNFTVPTLNVPGLKRSTAQTGTAPAGPAALDIAKSLGFFSTPMVATSKDLVSTIWSKGQLAAKGTFDGAAMAEFEQALQTYNRYHLLNGRALDVGMIMVSLGHLAKNGVSLSDAALVSQTVAGVVDRVCSLMQEGAVSNPQDTSDKVDCDDVLGDILWGLAVVNVLPPQSRKLRVMAQRAAQPEWLAGRSPRMIGKVLWSLAQLQSMGAPPLLTPHGVEWRRLCDGFICRSVELRKVDDAAMSFFKDALTQLSGGDGPAVGPAAGAAGSPRSASASVTIVRAGAARAVAGAAAAAGGRCLGKMFVRSYLKSAEQVAATTAVAAAAAPKRRPAAARRSIA